TWGGVDPVPRNAPPHELGVRLCSAAQVGVPPVVVLGELVLVQRPLAWAGLRHECVLDPDAQVQSAVLVPLRHLSSVVSCNLVLRVLRRHFMPLIATPSTNRRCTSR